jgi:hypothetical protein
MKPPQSGNPTACWDYDLGHLRRFLRLHGYICLSPLVLSLAEGMDWWWDPADWGSYPLPGNGIVGCTVVR